MHYLQYCKHLTVKITKWHNSCKTDPWAPVLLPNMHFWLLRCGENLNTIGETLHKLYSKTLKCWQNDRMNLWRTGWKQYTPIKLRFAGGIIELEVQCVVFFVVVENEFHFLFECCLYNDLRIQYMDSHFYTNPNQLKLKQLIHSAHEKQVTDLTMFIQKTFTLRNTLCY